MREYIVSETLQGAIRTLPEALQLAKAEAGTLKDGEAVRIVIDGVQHLEQTIRIAAKDLPGAEHPVFVEGADDASGFSGGKKITGFIHWKNNIWRVKVPEVEYTRHLYIDGKSAKRPATPYKLPVRWDKLEDSEYQFGNLPGEEEEIYWAENGIGADSTAIKIYSGIATTHTEIAEWKNTRDLEMVFEVGWVHRIVPIEDVIPLEDGRLYIKPVEPAFRSCLISEGVQIGSCPNYIENVFELLGKPYEWYFDRTEQMLYVGFEEGDTPCQHEIVIPLVEQLIEVKGELDHQPCHLNFRNLQFFHTTWLRPQKHGLPEIQACQLGYKDAPPKELVLEKPYEYDHAKVIAALRIIAAKDISFEACAFSMLGTGALQYEFGAQDCCIIGNRFYEIGGGAVTVGDFYGDRAHHPQDRREIVRGIVIKNNLIHDTGVDFRGSVAIHAGYVQDVDIVHNEIHDVPYSAISLGWGWGEVDVSVGPLRPTPWTEPTVCMRNRIMYNHIYRCMLKLCDGGAIYALGCMPGTSIIGNYIHESAEYHGKGYEGERAFINGRGTKEVHDPAGDDFWNNHKGVPGGIYLDEGCQGIDVCNNILHDVVVPLFYHNQIDEGYNRVWFRDNILNKWPKDAGFPIEAAACAGQEPLYRYHK